MRPRWPPPRRRDVASWSLPLALLAVALPAQASAAPHAREAPGPSAVRGSFPPGPTYNCVTQKARSRSAPAPGPAGTATSEAASRRSAMRTARRGRLGDHRRSLHRRRRGARRVRPTRQHAVGDQHRSPRPLLVSEPEPELAPRVRRRRLPAEPADGPQRRLRLRPAPGKPRSVALGQRVDYRDLGPGEDDRSLNGIESPDGQPCYTCVYAGIWFIDGDRSPWGVAKGRRLRAGRFHADAAACDLPGPACHGRQLSRRPEADPGAPQRQHLPIGAGG